METKSFRVEGMDCNHCQATVTKVLQNVQGVSEAIVSLEASEAKVTFDPAQVGEERLAAAVDAAGYKLVSA